MTARDHVEGDGATTFTVRCGPGPSAPTSVAVDGELSVETSAGFRAVLAEVTSDQDVTFDLRKCTFVDHVGLNALAGAAARIRSHGGRVTTVNVPAQFSAALEQVFGVPAGRRSRPLVGLQAAIVSPRPA